MLFGMWRKRTAEIIGERLRAQSEQAQQEQVQTLLNHMADQFSSLSLQALNQSTSQLVQLAKSQLGAQQTQTSQELDSKKHLIDQQLNQMGATLEQVRTLMTDVQAQSGERLSALTTEIRNTADQTKRLTETTNTLRETLANSRARGAWGERMAEDVLRAAGLLPNIHYTKQTTTAAGTRPDFTFKLPKDLCLNMDVKFPLDNYLRALEAVSDSEREQFEQQFLRDVRSHVKAVASRDYIDPAANTVECALLFIPLEQVYGFILQRDSTLLENSLGKPRRPVLALQPLRRAQRHSPGCRILLAAADRGRDAHATGRVFQRVVALCRRAGKIRRTDFQHVSPTISTRSPAPAAVRWIGNC